jgi:hypothetical protein
MAFGPLDHLQLTWIDLSLDEGDRGFFISENEQRRRIAFSVENTSGTAEPVRLLYAVPSPSRRISRSMCATPARRMKPMSTTCAASRHGTSTVAPGETARIEMTVELTWPDEMILNWAP